MASLKRFPPHAEDFVKKAMSADFGALAAAVGAGLGEVRACLIVSRDGLALGSYPPAEEAGAMQKWTRLASLGDVGRGFVVVGEECWVFCRRGPYSALAIARASARPGLILERLDQIVLTAEEARLHREGIAPQSSRDAAASAATRRRRPTTPPTGVHPQTAPQSPRPGEPSDVRAVRGPDVPVVLQGTAAAPTQSASSVDTPAGPGKPNPPPDEKRPPDTADAQTGQAWWSPALPDDKKETGKTPGQRTVWVLDADDLTKEFAGLIEDPNDPGRQ